MHQKCTFKYLDEEDLVVGLPLEAGGLLRLHLKPLQSKRQLVLVVKTNTHMEARVRTRTASRLERLGTN